MKQTIKGVPIRAKNVLVSNGMTPSVTAAIEFLKKYKGQDVMDTWTLAEEIGYSQGGIRHNVTTHPQMEQYIYRPRYNVVLFGNAKVIAKLKRGE